MHDEHEAYAANQSKCRRSAGIDIREVAALSNRVEGTVALHPSERPSLASAFKRSAPSTKNPVIASLDRAERWSSCQEEGHHLYAVMSRVANCSSKACQKMPLALASE